MDLLDFPSSYNELRRIQESDEPSGARETKALAAAAEAAVDPLLDWARDFVEALEEVSSKAEELQDADADDRADCHGELTAAAALVLDELVELGLTESTVAGQPLNT